MATAMVSTTRDPSSPPPDGALPPDEDQADPEPGSRPLFQPVSARGPALIVLGIAIFIVVLGVVGSALSSGGTPTLKIHSVKIPDGTVVDLTPATTAMKAVVSAGQPPADILGNLAVPTGSRVTRTDNIDQNTGMYDRTVVFSTGLSSDQVTEVFHALLPRLGWQVIYDGSGASSEAQSTEVLAKKASGDSFYWEVGATVSPTDGSGRTAYSVELFELDDAD
jgi:hypothetical protein